MQCSALHCTSPGRFYPFFLCLTISRVLPLAFTCAVLHHLALTLYIPVILGLAITYVAFPCWKYRMTCLEVVKRRGWNNILMTPLRSMVTVTSKPLASPPLTRVRESL